MDEDRFETLGEGRTTTEGTRRGGSWGERWTRHTGSKGRPTVKSRVRGRRVNDGWMGRSVSKTVPPRKDKGNQDSLGSYLARASRQGVSHLTRKYTR